MPIVPSPFRSKLVADAKGTALTALASTTTIAALTENTAAIGGTNDGNLPALTTVSGSYTQAEVTAIRDAVRETAAAINTLTTRVNNITSVLDALITAAGTR